MKYVPFTAHISIVPDAGKRQEKWLSMQKIASIAYEGLLTIVPSVINIAIPGGGQKRTLSGLQRGGIGSYSDGLAVKPAFGNYPSQMMITGFYDTSNQNIQPEEEHLIISGGESYYGSRSQLFVQNEKLEISNQVRNLRQALDTAIGTNMPASVIYSVFRIDYNGIIYGNRGIHFPR
jgi:hypothetical protein